MPGTDMMRFLGAAGAALDGRGVENPRVRSSEAGGVAAGESGDVEEGLNAAAGAGIVLSAAAPPLLGLAATTAGALGSAIAVEKVGLDDVAFDTLPAAAGAASTIRIASSPALLAVVENDDAAGEGVEMIGAAALGVAEISLRIVPPLRLGLAPAAGSVTIGGNVLESVGVGAGGW
jgi:hypothetical protein